MRISHLNFSYLTSIILNSNLTTNAYEIKDPKSVS